MCCKGLLKSMMFLFNGIIFLAGVAILAVGIWVKVDSGSLMGLLENVDAPAGLDQLVNVSYLLIAVGAVLLVIGFLGCCGAVRESRCMLLTFFSIVLIIFLAEVAGAIVLFVFKDVAETLIKSLEHEVKKDIQNNYGEKEQVTDLWNATMEQFQCCGFMNYTDFEGIESLNSSFPSFCCNSTLHENECSLSNAMKSNVPGCFEKLVDFIEDNTLIVAGVALGIAALEIAAMVVSMILYKDIGRKR